MISGSSTDKGVIEARNADISVATESAGARASNKRKISPNNGAQNGVASNISVHELLECPVCMDIMYPPIHQCPNGHTLCSKCQSKVRCCPICRQELGNIRCLALERVAESLELPCKYQILGCQEIIPYNDRLKHKKSCRFRPYICPHVGVKCRISGTIPLLMAHLRRDHQVDVHDGCTFKHRYVKKTLLDVENVTWMLTVFNCYGHQFCLHFEASNLGMAPVYIAFMRFMGDDEDARKFRYSLKVVGNRRKMTWQGVPRSIRDSHVKVRDSRDGLIIHKSTALLFSSGNSQEVKLKVAGRIWKEKEAAAA